MRESGRESRRVTERKGERNSKAERKINRAGKTQEGETRRKNEKSNIDLDIVSTTPCL